jgi:hypothetical protein
MALPHLAGDTNMADMSSADPFWGNEGNRYAPDPADVEPAPETAASASGHADAPQMVEEPEEEDDSEGESSSGSDWGNRSAKRTGVSRDASLLSRGLADALSEPMAFNFKLEMLLLAEKVVDET